MSGEQRLQKIGLFINKQIIKGGQQPQVNNQFFNNQPQNNQVEFLNQKWKICNPGCNRQSVELSSIMDQSQNQNESITFIFNDRDIVSINQQKLVAKGLIQVESQVYDLSQISSFSQAACEAALTYCHSGYAELNSEDFPFFLIVCLHLKIDQPFILVANFFQSQPMLDLKLNNCKVMQNIEQGISKCLKGSIHFQVLEQLQAHLANSNPYFFLVRNTQQIQTWVQDLDEDQFQRLVPELALKTFCQTDKGSNTVSFGSVSQYFDLLSQYYSIKLPKEKKDSPEIVFQKNFDLINTKLSEEDQILCLQFLPIQPNGDNVFLNKLLLLVQQNNNLKLREKAYTDVIISQIAHKIAIASLNQQFQSPIEITSGKQLEQGIKQQVEERVQTLKQNKY